MDVTRWVDWAFGRPHGPTIFSVRDIILGGISILHLTPERTFCSALCRKQANPVQLGRAPANSSIKGRSFDDRLRRKLEGEGLENIYDSHTTVAPASVWDRAVQKMEL